MTSNSAFSNPFHTPSNDPETMGSYTSCQGPPARNHASPVAKLGRQIASALTSKPAKHNTDTWKPEPFDTEVVILDFVAEKKPKTRTASPAPPSADKIPKPSATPSNLEPLWPFDTNVVIIDFVEDGERKQSNSDKGLRHISSQATLADPSRSAHSSSPPSSTENLLENITSIRTSTPYESLPATATAGDGGEYSQRDVGRSLMKGCQCHCGCAQYRVTNAKLNRCSCSCKNCRGKHRKLPKKFLKVLQSR